MTFCISTSPTRTLALAEKPRDKINKANKMSAGIFTPTFANAFNVNVSVSSGVFQSFLLGTNVDVKKGNFPKFEGKQTRIGGVSREVSV